MNCKTFKEFAVVRANLSYDYHQIRYYLLNCNKRKIVQYLNDLERLSLINRRGIVGYLEVCYSEYVDRNNFHELEHIVGFDYGEFF